MILKGKITDIMKDSVKFKKQKDFRPIRAILLPRMFLITILGMVFLLLVISSITDAQNIPPEMKIRSTPNPVGSGARALGIGGAFISIADDATAASWNPAGLIKLKRPEFSAVGSFFSGRRRYDTSFVAGEIDDRFNGQLRLNYSSIALPFMLLSRNMVFSLNYQHLYEFSEDTFYLWAKSIEASLTDTIKTSQIKQKGGLGPLSPALAIQIVPSFYIGITANFWMDDLMNNYWENIKTVHEDGIVGGERKKTFAELYERYEFSGFNSHLGFLWRINRLFTLGGVIKTPFKADIDHELHYVSISEYPDEPVKNEYIRISSPEQFKLKMPMSYGLGFSIHFSDTYSMALDVYKTEWDEFLMCTPSGDFSPINNKLEHEAAIKTTTQIRLGAEYLLIQNKNIIPIRTGIFYDPEPASGRVDDFYGISMGTGILFRDFSFDVAYQYRFGEKRKAASLLGEEISSNVKQHYLYSSIIFYF